MTVETAGLASVSDLADLNRRLSEDEGHPDRTTVADLAEAYGDWLRGEAASPRHRPRPCR